MLKKIWKDRRGEGYIDVAIGVFCLMIVLAFAVAFLPVFTEKMQLDVFANEVVRQAEIVGSTSVSDRITQMQDETGLNPTISWDCDYYSGNRVQLNQRISVTLTDTVDIGFFVFGSWPITIRAEATGRSEVYYK